MSGFITKIDYSDNRQIRQSMRTSTDLSGATVHGVTFSALTSGPDPNNSGTTSTLTPIYFSFSGNTGETVYSFADSTLDLGAPNLGVITDVTSGNSYDTIAFTASSTTVIDGNTVALAYTGVSYNLSIYTTVSGAGPIFTGSGYTNNTQLLSASTLDFTGRTIWLDVNGITRTEKLIVSDNPILGYVLTCSNIEGMAEWQPSSGATSGTSYWSASSGTNAIIPIYSNSIASGQLAIAIGTGTTAAGGASLAEGYLTIASGDASHAEGLSTSAFGLGSHAEGDKTKATGASSHAEGSTSKAFGDYSHAEGVGTIAIGYNSHAEGNNTTTVGQSSHAEGTQTSAMTIGAHAEGLFTIVSGDYGHAEGYQSIASGDYAHAEGGDTIASGLESHAEGAGAKAMSAQAHAEGAYTTASGQSSHAEGISTITAAVGAHAEGASTTAYTQSSHAEGAYTKTLGTSAHAEGGFTTAVGDYTHAQGNTTIAIGMYSHAGGELTTASGTTSFVHSRNSVAVGARSAVLGGQNITGTSADTVYVPDLVIDGLPNVTDLQTDANGLIIDGASDIQFKTNIESITNSLDIIRQLNPISFEWKPEINLRSGTVYGLIAQEVQNVIPNIVKQRSKGEGLTLEYKELIPWIIKAIQELVSGGTQVFDTETILAEDNNIELNYNGTHNTAIGGGIVVAKGVNDTTNSSFTTDENGNFLVSPAIIPNKIILPQSTPTSTNDSSGSIGELRWDDNYCYIKTNNGWKRANLETF